MKVLGIIGTDSAYHPAACLLVDGRLVAFAEEERFVRVKGAYSLFPAQATRYCLEQAGIRLADVDAIAYGWDAQLYRYYMPWFFAKTWMRDGGRGGGGDRFGAWQGVMRLLQYRPEFIRGRIKVGLRRAGLYDRIPPIHFVNHHLSHAASTYYASGFDNALVFTLDGHGEDTCTAVWHGQGTTLRRLAKVTIPHSLGWFYSAFTEYLGFKPNQDEGKLMGLAAYGRLREEDATRLAQVLRFDASTGEYEFDPTFSLYGACSHGTHFSDRLVALFGLPRAPGDPIEDRHRDLAFAVQDRLEQAVLALVGAWVRRTGVRNVCLAGGVALNCKMNGRVMMSDLVDRIFVQPAAYDAGVALGAAMVVSLAQGADPRFRMEHGYWGPAYSDDEIKAALSGCQLRYTREAHIGQAVGERLAAGKMVGWFQGRMEVGARALGGRSILANPLGPTAKDAVNRRVKYREPWRPFCPSVLAEAAGEFLAVPGDAPFMIVANQVAPKHADRIESVVHVDGSIRPQTVRADLAPDFYEAIKTFGEITGVPCVLNTSFNVKGEPIVIDPLSAIRCFFGTGLDALAIGSYLLEKPG